MVLTTLIAVKPADPSKIHNLALAHVVRRDLHRVAREQAIAAELHAVGQKVVVAAAVVLHVGVGAHGWRICGLPGVAKWPGCVWLVFGVTGVADAGLTVLSGGC